MMQNNDHPIQERQFFVRSDNIMKKGSYMGIKIIRATSGQELLEKACIAYELPWPPIQPNGKGPFSIHLWSGQLGMQNRIRVDNLTIIPSHISEVWLRFSDHQTQ